MFLVLAQYSALAYYQINAMNFKTILTRLYFMLVYADGTLNDREISLGKVLVTSEGIDENEFHTQMEALKSKDQSVLLSDSLGALKKLSRKQQIRCIAWLCVVANADGFMDKTEWHFIYNIYHKSLSLPLDEIMAVQKQLNQIGREKTTEVLDLMEAA